jgi:tetratricopeptide (TPR) repeat protein
VTTAEATERAALLLSAGRAGEALALVSPLLAGVDDPGAHVVAVAALLELDRPPDAVRAAESALAAFGPLPQLARVAAAAFRAAGSGDRALAVARAGSELAPQWVPGLLTLAFCALETGDREQATVALDAATALAPDEPAVWLLAADVASAAGRRPLARSHLQTALRLDPASTTALRALGRLEELRNRPGSAARWYARALLLEPGDPRLVERVRALFGRLLGAVTVAAVCLGFVIVLAFLAQADPAPGGSTPAELPEPLFWTLWLVGGAVAVGAQLWSGLRGTPRVVLDALVSETRVHRRVRRCARLALAHAVVVLAAVLAASAPVGEPSDRLPVVVPLWLLSMALLVVTAIALRRTFGYGQTRAATG